MNRETMQCILGYLIGGFLVMILMPMGLYNLSRSFDPIAGIQLIPHDGLRITTAACLAAIGLLFAIWSVVIQNIVGKGGPLEIAGVEISPKTQKLVVTGPYKYTRNPMLFGACTFYYAIAVYLNSVVALAVVVLFMTFMLIFVVKMSEEPRLRKDFGAEYEAYHQRVSLFIPWIPKHPKSL
jgi:protein-S-isoprenylcysteine O-methyltransferase Ste14